jgi:glutamine amidotransferase
MIGIIDLEIGNINSVGKALDFLNVPFIKSNDPEQLIACSKFILPGVGHFKTAMNQMNKFKFDKFINEQVQTQKKPILGICLGMQLMCEWGYEGFEEENKAINGLALVKGSVRKIPNPNQDILIPHVGWNDVKKFEGTLFQDIQNAADFYFVHSYYCDIEESIQIAYVEHGQQLPCAFKKDNVYGVQFHPEKSQQIGIKLIKNFANIC